MLRVTIANERGFTLIKLLVVVMVIGLPAAIAVTTFVAQRIKAQDVSAKSDARNMVTEVETCYGGHRIMAAARRPLVRPRPRHPGHDRHEHERGHFLITATSRNDNTFMIERNGAAIDKTCTTTGSSGGGCPASLEW